MAFIGKNSVTVTSLDSAESMSVVTDLTVDTNTLKVDSVSNRVGILNATPSVSLDIGTATDAIHIPVGTTGERPGSPTSGLFRYNTSLNQFEGYTSTWGAIGGGGTNTFTHDSFTGDNSTTDFVLSQATESENNLFVFIDGVFQTQDAYSIATNSGITTLTLSAAPAQDRKIIVYTVAAGVSGNNLNQNLFDANTSDAVDGVNDTFTLSIPPVNKNNTQVFFDGVYQHKANYSVSGTSLTFTDAPPLGVVVEVMIFTQTAVNVPVDNSVTSSKLSGDLVAPGNLTVTGYLAGPSTFILDPSAVGDNTGTLLVKGNLQVDGTQTIINSTTLTVDDLNITLASGAANALAADGAGITIDTGSDPDATITYDGVNDRWNFNKNVDVTGTALAHEIEIGDGSAGGTSEILFSDNVSARGKILYDHSSNPETMLLQTTGTTAISIDNSQNVSMPNGNLDVTGTLGVTGVSTFTAAINQTTESPSINLTDSSSSRTLSVNVDDNNSFLRASGPMLLQSGGALTTLALDASQNMALTGNLSTTGGAVFNEGGVDSDFRVESSGNANMLFVDAGTDKVGVGVSDPQAELFVRKDTTGPARIGISNAGTVGATTSSRLAFYEGNTETSYIERRRDGSGETAIVTPAADNPVNIEINGGNELASFTGSSIIFNEDSGDQDFRVESVNNTHALFLDASTSRVGINTSNPGAPLEVGGGIVAYSINSVDDGIQVRAFGSNTDANKLRLSNNGADVAIGRNIATWPGTWDKADDSAASGGIVIGADGAMAYYQSNAADTSPLQYNRFIIYQGGNVTVNESGTDSDFRVESDNNANMLFVDGGLNIVSVGSNSVYQSGALEVFAQSDTSSQGVSINGVSSATSFRLYTVGDVAKIGRGGDNPAISISTGNAVTINEDSLDADFRVESVNNDHMLFMDAGNDAVIVGSSSHSGKFSAPFQVSDKGALKSFGFSGTSAVDLDIPINAGNNGMAALMVATRNTGAGTSTASAVYLLNFYFDGNNAPASTFITGTDFITFGVSGTNTLTVQNSVGGNVSLIMMMAG